MTKNVKTSVLGRGALLEGPKGFGVFCSRSLYSNISTIWAGTAKDHIEQAVPGSLLTDHSKAAAFLEKDLPKGIRTIFGTGIQTVGADPEIFALTPSGAVIPAWEFLPAESAAEAKAHSKAYWDGFQAEFSTTIGYSCIAYLIDALWDGLNTINTELHLKHPEAQLVCKDVVELSRKALLSAAPEHITLGCAPSANAYGIEPIAVPEPRDLPLRFSGCHTHHSVANSPDYPTHLPSWFPNGTVVMMDKILGLCLTALGRGLEDPRRRKFYGRPGEYRLPKRENSISIEYRTPGAFCMQMPEIAQFLYDVSRISFNLGMVTDGRSYFLPDAKDIILNCDADAAWGVINKHKEFFTTIFEQCWPGTISINKVFTLLKSGIAQSSVWEPSVCKAWRLKGNKHFDGHTTTFAAMLRRV